MQDPRRCEAAWHRGSQLSGCVWQRFADTFLQNLLVFLQHCWKQPTFCFPCYCPWVPRSLCKFKGNVYSFEIRDCDSFWLLTRSLFPWKGSHAPREVSAVAGSRLAPSDTLTSPLALAISMAAGSRLSHRKEFHWRFPGLETCKHTCLLTNNSLHVLGSLTI